ncbi:SprT family protein [Streptococcus cuniculipharyngis]|uniref:Protein SprT-like n=1 Tax=Streptococcus cuniculipharyngis TaxID=1562651 RepID=A0A5C5SB06_9STRE|nr:SprT family protein [Streptococcus cuniculipharyngis]TWS98067.1 SprT family protein [Streptococcus cuniculipharyngis]
MRLTDYVKQVSLEDFGWEFTHQAYWNKRLRTTGGRFFPGDGHLDFNLGIYQEYGEAIFRKIVRHELCHYHLYFQGRGYRHRDQDFKQLLAQVDGLRYAPSLSEKGNGYHYFCVFCHLSYQRKRRLNLARYRCGKCHGRLKEKNQS